MRSRNTLQLTELETQTFELTGRTLSRWRIDGTRSVPATLRLIAGNYPGVSGGWANMVYVGVQTPAPAVQAPPAAASSAQYVVNKLHLLEAHRITSGDDVLVAVIDSKIDTKHPDLTGVVADEYDVVGSPAIAHSHGTAMAGAIAARSKLIGVAPKVKLLAVRAFSGSGESAESTTFNILKSVDWAASKNARIINMSFAGPPDDLLREILTKANARGIVLIAAVGNAGPRSPPLYPAADAGVIGVTATDVDDKLMPQANRGPQVACGGARCRDSRCRTGWEVSGDVGHFHRSRACQRGRGPPACIETEPHAGPGARQPHPCRDPNSGKTQ